MGWAGEKNPSQKRARLTLTFYLLFQAERADRADRRLHDRLPLPAHAVALPTT